MRDACLSERKVRMKWRSKVVNMGRSIGRYASGALIGGHEKYGVSRVRGESLDC